MKRLGVRLAASYLAVAVIVLAAAGWLTYIALQQHLRVARESTLAAQLDAAALMAMALAPESGDPAAVAAEVYRQYPEVKVTVEALAQPYRITVMKTPSGNTMVLSSGVKMLVSKPGAPVTERAVPVVGPDGMVWQVLRVAPGDVDTGVARLRTALLGAGALGLFAALGMAFWFSRTLTAPLQRMALAAGRLAEGEWETPMPAGGPTEMTALAEAFRAMAARLRTDFHSLRADREALQRLAAEVVHELKTPVASLRAYHELLLDGEQENSANREELLRRGASQVARLEYLAEFLVDMARLQAHTAPLDREEADLAELVRQAVSSISPLAAQRGVQVKAELPGAPSLALVSPHRIGQALDNLLQNAVRHTPEGSAVTVSLKANGGTAEISVEDEGPGIEPELMPRLFEPFARGAASRGLGMGLAIVKAVAESHGGSSAGRNRPGGGAVFTVWIPLQGD